MNYHAELLIRKLLLRPPLSMIGWPFFYLRTEVFPSASGRSVRRYAAELNRTEFAPIEKLVEIRDKKLRHLIQEAYANVPYYREVMRERSLTPDDFSSPQDLQALPILTKTIVREHFDALLNRQVPKEELIKVSTGGTTGTPLHLLVNPHARAVALAHWDRWKKYAGISSTDRCIFIATDHAADNNARYEGRFSGNTVYMAASFGLDDNRLESYWRNMQWFKPVYVRGFAFACYILADFFVRKGIRFPMKAVITSGDMVYPYFRDTIREAFDCEIFDHYGQNEDIVTANECGAHQGLHINIESCHAEILNEKNGPCPEGAMGHIVGTHLENTCMPLIRYDTCDMGRISAEPCVCGRCHPRIIALDGRTDDWITLRNGRKIGHQLSVTMKQFHREIRETQFIQDSLDHLHVKVVASEKFNDDTKKGFEHNIRDQVGHDIQITFEVVGDIPKTSRGKHRLIISKIASVNRESGGQ